ncbi:MAG: hypothetical protein MN733_24890 [Nitrososphaera sp.]|nr:hypothetical protein [Nitrososphaera sp.]
MIKLLVSDTTFEIVTAPPSAPGTPGKRGRPPKVLAVPPPATPTPGADPSTLAAVRKVKAKVLHGVYVAENGNEHEGDQGVLRYEDERGKPKLISVDMTKIVLKNSVEFSSEMRAQWQQEAAEDIIAVAKVVFSILYCTREEDLRRLLSITTQTRVSWRETELTFKAITLKVEDLRKMGFSPRLVVALRAAGAVA